MRLAIYGAGGHGKVVWDILSASGCVIVGFVDDNVSFPKLLGIPVVSHVDALPSFDGVVIAIGNNRIRQTKFTQLGAEGYNIVNAIHPSAILSDQITLGRGVVIGPGAIVNIGTRIGDNVILNTGASVDHDGHIGDHVHIAPGTHLGGNVVVEEGAFLGLGTRVIPGMRIGTWATCGAGAVIIRNVVDGDTVVGIPARSLKRQ